MTSTNMATTRQPSKAGGRRALHEARIAAAPAGSTRRRWLTLAWLHAEVAASGRDDEVYRLADAMNREAR